VHRTERNALKGWISSALEFIHHLLGLGTTVMPAEIDDLSLVQLRQLSRVVQATSESHLRLYPVPRVRARAYTGGAGVLRGSRAPNSGAAAGGTSVTEGPCGFL
jgi:hypothetical protein